MHRIYQILLPLLGLFFTRVELTEFGYPRVNVYEIRVLDGDTVDIRTDIFKERVRFLKVDAPELKQNYLNGQKGAGKFSKRCLENILKKRPLSFEGIKRDMYGRLLGEIFIEEKSVSFEMIQQGCTTIYPLAVFSSKKEKGIYIRAMIFAQRRRVGIWKNGGVLSPYHYRKFSTRISRRQ